ncbi:RNA polymerase Rpb4 family protein [Halobacterium litoreum]|uniref:DNA-directed RNA polymerase subunit Rpo4 n=1 Tax=Halobacterium litoreum TaxID=2039234 RepID=A0ABD5NCF9_9EURY|nr:RNA polymerase Rpb4 family protein [Halobacterium litoreum]UHH14271.1 RNA polymerase Rpb4 family protein [Halobacterium litoreum]
MTIFKETLDEEFLTVSEAKELLSDVEAERALDEDREMRFELARAVEHVNRFAVLEPEESRELVAELLDLDALDDESVAYKIADLLPRTRTELRAVFANERYALSGDELDDVLDVVAKYA